MFELQITFLQFSLCCWLLESESHICVLSACSTLTFAKENNRGKLQELKKDQFWFFLFLLLSSSFFHNLQQCALSCFSILKIEVYKIKFLNFWKVLLAFILLYQCYSLFMQFYNAKLFDIFDHIFQFLL